MGYLNKQTVTVDAILTKKGRQLLAQGRNAFNITKFAVADDEIDYGLYNPAHPLGSEYYGSVIENMPIIEASPDETQNLRYKLVTLTRGSGVNVIPQIALGGIKVDDGLELDANEVSVVIVPSTTNDLDNTDGYTLTLFNSEAAQVGAEGGVANEIQTLSGTASVIQGSSFTITGKDVSTDTITQVRVTGNNSGATVTFPLTVLAATI